MSEKAVDYVIAVAASIVSFLLSWPYWRDFGYWPESKALWLAYFVVGFVLAVYVFLVMIRALRILFIHESHHSHEHEEGGR